MPHLNPTFGQSAVELQRQIELERDGAPFLVLRSEEGEQVLVALSGRERVTIGRGEGIDVRLDGDRAPRDSTRARFIGGSWLVVARALDHGTSSRRARGLAAADRDRELIRIGGTGILFRDPAATDGPGPTVAADDTATVRTLTATQRGVLVALCRPYASGDSFATPATNREIAESVHLSVDAVKGHLRVLFDRFGLGELPQNEKRARLAEQALRAGAVRASELG